MRILIGGFAAESNAYGNKPCEKQDFSITTGDSVADILSIS
jgi:microcystin degradation protein MlrC